MKQKLNICLAKNICIFLITIYRNSFSFLLGPCCRFTPSCSLYALQSIERFGLKNGLILTFKRIIKCHPFHPGGYDPVPEITFQEVNGLIKK
jgi:putative membrane protein insertion efficiency factor